MAEECVAYEGILLSSRITGEHDRLYQCYTRQRGMVWFRARGVLKAASRLRPFLTLCSPISLELLEGRSYPILVGAEPLDVVKAPPSFYDDVVNVSFGHALGSFLILFFKNPDADEEFFSWLLQSLAVLYILFEQDGDSFLQRRSLLLYGMLLGTFSHLGRQLLLYGYVDSSEKLRQSDHYSISFSAGGLIQAPLDRSSSYQCTHQELLLLRVLQQGDLSLLVRLTPPDCWPDFRRFCDAYIDYIAERHLVALDEYWDYELGGVS